MMANPNNVSTRQTLEARCKNSRSNLLLVVAFTVINVVLLITNSNTYFLFSAYIPYAIADFGMLFCGKYPAEYYVGELAGTDFLPSSAFGMFVAIAAVVVCLYLLCWIFSKKNRMGWLIFALVIFVIDTLGMLAFLGFDLSNIVDMIFHAWVIVSLVMGIIAAAKLKKLPEEEPVVSEVGQGEEIVAETENTSLDENQQ